MLSCKECLTSEMNAQLKKLFTLENIIDALSSMCLTKPLGPKGFSTVFFKKHWQTIRRRVVTMCLHIFNEQDNSTIFNHKHISLIPKIAKPRKVTDYKPISFYNVMYRIVAKAMSNIIKPILSQIIFPTQSVFIPNGPSTDNVVVGYKWLHKIRHSKGKRNSLVTLKLDINKAYDKVKRQFLKQTRYYKNSSFFSANASFNPSFFMEKHFMR